jgi:hypothetical protein
LTDTDLTARNGLTFMKEKGVLAALSVVLVLVGIGVGYIAGTSGSPKTVTVTTVMTGQGGAQAPAPYVLTLVVTTNNHYNSSVGDQPAFYVLGPKGLQSSANISLPAHRLIKLVLINYDSGAANLTQAKYSDVSGTVGNSILVINNSLIDSRQTSSGIDIRGAQNETSVPPSVIAHTFTIPSLGINIPVPTQSTVVAYFEINTPGTYTWFCMTLCGSGPNGLGGAMSTPGWMTGTVVVS